MNRSSGRIGPGASTILMIVIVLCMTMFGVLALVSARNDASVGARVRESETAYYNAQTEFGLWIKQVDEMLFALRQESKGDAQIYAQLVAARLGAQVGEKIQFTTDVGQTQELRCEVQISPLDSYERYEILCTTVSVREEADFEEDAEWNLIA